MSWIVLGPMLIGVVGLIAAALELAFGYRRLPKRIPTILNVDAVPTTNRGKLRALAAVGGRELTMPKTYLLLWFAIAVVETTSSLGRWETSPNAFAISNAIFSAVFCPFIAAWIALLVRKVGSDYRAGADVVSVDVARRITYVCIAAVVIAALYAAFALSTLR